MREYTGKLLEIASEPLCARKDVTGFPWEGRIFSELREVLAAKNGFYALASSIQVFGIGSACGEEVDVVEWNSDNCWRSTYGDLTKDLVFFAQDVFGFQFATDGNGIVLFESETGNRVSIASDVEGWARLILSDSYYSGYELARDWQIVNRPLAAGERLFPKIMFVLGGEYSVANLAAAEVISGMRFRGHVARQIKDLPDGTEIDFAP